MKPPFSFKLSELEILAQKIEAISFAKVQYIKINAHCNVLIMDITGSKEIELIHHKEKANTAWLIHIFEGVGTTKCVVEGTQSIENTEGINILADTSDYSIVSSPSHKGKWILMAVDADWLLENLHATIFSSFKQLGLSALSGYHVDQLKAVFLNESSQAMITQKMLLTNLFYQVLLELDTPNRDADNEDITKSLKAFLLGNLFGTLPAIGEFAVQNKLSVNTLKTKFQQKEGMSIRQFFFDAQMKLAADLLNKDLNTKEIASQLGYANPSNFINAFKRKFGVSPSRHEGEDLD